MRAMIVLSALLLGHVHSMGQTIFGDYGSGVIHQYSGKKDENDQNTTKTQPHIERIEKCFISPPNNKTFHSFEETKLRLQHLYTNLENKQQKEIYKFYIDSLAQNLKENPISKKLSFKMFFLFNKTLNSLRLSPNPPMVGNLGLTNLSERLAKSLGFLEAFEDADHAICYDYLLHLALRDRELLEVNKSKDAGVKKIDPQPMRTIMY